jgi:PAT family beta-lactamase induction signal transducer AmpG
MPDLQLPPATPKAPVRIFALLEAPYGMNFALTTVVPMYLLRGAGLGIAEAGAMTAFSALPSTFYFAYSPIVDFFVRRRTWWLAAVLLTSLMAGLSVGLSGSAGRAQLVAGLLFTGTMASMMISAATGGMMSTLLDAPGKARVGAWVQLGNLGSNSLFFGLLLFLESRCSRPVLALVSSLMILLTGLAALKVREPARTKSDATYLKTLKQIGVELRVTLLSLRSLPGILMLVSPLGTGAITTVITGMSKDYGASNDQLGFANGWGGGLLTALGSMCVLGMPARWNRMIPYALSGIIYGSVSLLIACGPLRPSTLIAGLLASNFAQGICFAAYTGVVLQTMGVGGRGHSSRYTILNSIGNMPVVYMVALESLIASHFGARSIGLADGLLNLATAGIFFVWWVWVRARHPQFLAEPDVLAQA